MDQQTIIKLVDGNLMPQLGLGVWQTSNEQVVKAIHTALEVGYRSIDTAAIYHNESGVGKALKEIDIPREEIFVTTKLWNDRHQDAKAALEESLDKLQLDYIDLYLLHWPVPHQDQYVEAWKQLIELKESGLARSIGVCNFHIEHLQKLMSETSVVPAINQIELHPLMQQRQLHSWNATHHITTESWSPLSHGGKGVFDNPLVQHLATKYEKTPAQIVIRWHLDCGMIAIPKSVTPSRIKENFGVFDFRLEKEDLTAMAELDIGKRIGPNPDTYTGDHVK
ncbi:2,5-didehydrogluconate reductase DkgA [Xenorhabdus bovienii]|uniref:2,5-diketo-D-gluconate reductase A n=1 Tax=Xenorhabdus bovienii str. Intermedium TaxID=1379677 RepID=A0A077Q598_XENBV|nr:2,5-didehydrogluconate reductase DkgA [Xenorhabdus bovienii]MDE9452356.1 2,5-didehydrogluconate reductase DkgA [Xenorhabdus bovienii]MDE9480728.1 2,5-didehydrogluconate reductase DkgA [Xenorhabdus bovienii]MDE9541473.1 2,5-didehydrogluconate reductase DkgA [Xenorhabdus bovienii]MDE9549781.1 2,5-didehydrogluconate reductase DkgA [Xenorhabdus bovienii]MDE9555289.1 2,5-didehydrogluconate reductase DkgA [Xenorhabdus bovienii]